MSFTKKMKKLRRDPEIFFKDSLTKQYSNLYKTLNFIRESKDGITKGIASIKNYENMKDFQDKSLIVSKFTKRTNEFNNKEANGIKSESIKKSSLVSTTSTIFENVKSNVEKNNKYKKSFKDYFEELTFFTEQYNVNSIKIKDEIVWPYIRYNLWIHLNFVAIGRNNYKNVTTVHVQNSHRVQFNRNFIVEAKEVYGAVEEEEIDFKADVLFFTNINAAEQTTIEDGIYYRVCDPFLEVAKEICSVEKIELIRSASASLEKTKEYVHKAKLILPPIVEKKGYSFYLDYDQSLFSKFEEFVPSLNPLDKIKISENIDYEINMKDFYKRVLTKISPKILFLQAFHYHSPLIAAADELGILTVDLQHGLQVGWNPLYTNYDEMPPEGYSQIPDYFAVWGKKEYQNILKSFPSNKHRPIYMGAPWLEKIKTFPASLPPKILDELESSKYDQKILIIMQNQTDIPQIFIDIIEETRNDNILWVIRHHPKGKLYVKENFSKSNSKIIIDNEIDKALFSELFKYVDITISEGSALAIEASYFGVTNVVTSEMGANNYRKEINDGVFYYLKNSTQLQTVLKEIKNNGNNIDTSHIFKKVDTEVFIKNLLKSADEKKSNLNANKNFSRESTYKRKLKIEAEIISNLEKANYLIESFDTDSAMAAFEEIRKLLVELPTAKEDYNKDQMLYIKEARVFQRKIREKFNIVHGEQDILLVSDSLALPRPRETENVNFGMTRSYAYMFNNNSYGLTMLPWAQRYLTTSKLLERWDEITGNLTNKHLVIHIGINDFIERVFSEEQKTAMASLNPEISKGIIEFGQTYCKEIFQSQYGLSYVPFNKFEANVQQIVARALDSGVLSLTFIGIIPFSKSHEGKFPGAIENCIRYNAVLKQAAVEFERVGYIETKDVLDSVKKNVGLLTDNVHLSIPGHRALASAIFSKLSIEGDKNKTYRVALIGVGNLGSRHLQGLAKSKNKLSIECFEPNQSNMNLALERFKEVIDNNDIALKFVDSLQGFSENIDVAIIATNSDIRAQVVEELLTNKNVGNLILEKVLFQDISSYSLIEELIKESNVEVWVNHPRRMFDIHSNFLAEIRKSKKLSFQVSGVNWGLGSNGLHFLDLLAWMTHTEQEDVELEWNKIGRSVTQSKRPQFKEIFGTISGVINTNTSFSITSLLPTKNEVQLPTITVVSDTIKLFIDEYNGVISYALVDDGWKWHTLEGDFPLLFQSEMTTTVIDQILEKGACDLPSYKSAMWLHVPFIKAIKKGIEEIEGLELDNCPIS